MVLNKTTEHLFDSAHLYKLLSSLIVQRNYFSFTLFFLLPNYLFKSFLSLGFPYPFRLFLNVSFLCLYTHFTQRSIIRLEPSGFKKNSLPSPFRREFPAEKGVQQCYTVVPVPSKWIQESDPEIKKGRGWKPASVSS
jgi:hypothetical protein